MISRAWLGAILVGLAASGAALRAEDDPVEVLKRDFDGPVEEAEFRTAIQTLLKNGRFEELTALAEKWNREKARTLNGAWKIEILIRSCSVPDNATDEDFDERMAKIDEWRIATPESPVPDIARLQIQRQWASHIFPRGENRTPENIQKYQHRNDRLDATLRRVWDRRKEYPQIYIYKMYLEWARVTGPQSREAVFDEGIAASPGYLMLYYTQIQYLFSENGYDADVMRAFVARLREKVPPELKTEIVGRVMWNLTSFDDLLGDPETNWPALKEGFEAIMKSFPRSGWNLNAFAFEAVRAHDRETAKTLFEKIGETTKHLYMWKTEEVFRAARDWALNPDAEYPGLGAARNHR